MLTRQTTLLRLQRFSSTLRHQLGQGFVRLGYHSRPQFLIIGAQKAGTTALYYYLADHPSIIPAYEKEIGFFTPERFQDLPSHPYYGILCPRTGPIYSNSAAYAKAAAWYHSLFPPPHVLGRHRLTFEATPEYLYYANAAERISKYNPEMKLIVLLRDPVERALSAWNMYYNFDDPVYSIQRETRSFDEAVTAELEEIATDKITPGAHYVRRGLYYDQLLRYFKFFNREQILVIDSRCLKSNAAGVLNDVAAFLGLPGHASDASRSLIHVGRYEMRPAVHSTELLREFYGPHNQQLYQLLNQDFSWP